MINSDQDAISAPPYPLGRTLQPYVRAVPSGPGSGEAGHDVRLLAEIVEQLRAELAARDQRQANTRGGHDTAFATPPKRR